MWRLTELPALQCTHPYCCHWYWHCPAMINCFCLIFYSHAWKTSRQIRKFQLLEKICTSFSPLSKQTPTAQEMAPAPHQMNAHWRLSSLDNALSNGHKVTLTCEFLSESRVLFFQNKWYIQLYYNVPFDGEWLVLWIIFIKCFLKNGRL